MKPSTPRAHNNANRILSMPVSILWLKPACQNRLLRGGGALLHVRGPDAVVSVFATRHHPTGRTGTDWTGCRYGCVPEPRYQSDPKLRAGYGTIRELP